MSKPVTAKCRDNSASRRGAALIITLAFVVLLTGLVVAYFSRATIDRQTSVASFNNAAADLLARGALDIVVADFKKEIDNTKTAVTSANILPTRSGDFASILNLIRRSFRSDALGVTSRASAVSSATDASVNGRSISTARWNSHYLIPMAKVDDQTFKAPDWVLMTRSGPKIEPGIGSGTTALYNSDPANTDYVVGRYAYAVYDEGGLLDANVAGYPSPAPDPATWKTDVGRKGILAFADLTTLPRSGGTLSTPSINRLVLFRNYATAYDPADPSPNTLGSTSFTSAAASLFANYYLSADRSGTTRDFGIVNPIKVGALPSEYRTDQVFASRSELIKFQKNMFTSVPLTSFTPDILQYLGTFSRQQNKGTWDKTTAWPTVFKGSNLVFSKRFFTGELNDVSHNNKDFGLIGGGSNYQYVGRNGSTPLANIPAISATDVNSADFFQILNYVLHPDWDATKDNDANNLATTLAIGAALIDQCDADFNPTRIDYNGGWVYGIEAGAQADSARPKEAPIPPAAYVPLFLNRPPRNVGEFGYGYKQGTARTDQTADFSTESATSLPLPADRTADAGLLDFFTYNTAGTHSGIININTRQAPVLAALLRSAIYNNSTLSVVDPNKTESDAINAANAIVAETTTKPAVSRADVTRLASKVLTLPFTGSDEAKETIARALAEVGQTRTWGLLIDLVAQTGRYMPNSASGPNKTNPLANFVVEGEKRYWLHVTLDRFEGTVLGQQLEEVIDQ